MKDVPQGSSNLGDVISHVLPKVKDLDAVIIFVTEGVSITWKSVFFENLVSFYFQ